MVEHHTATRICKGMSRRVVCSYAQVRALSTALKHFDCPRVVMTAFGKYRSLSSGRLNSFTILGQSFCQLTWNAKVEQFPKDKTFVVLYKADMKPYLEYVVNKYGNDFISLYE